MTLNQLGLFAKFWQPGSVKTRLASTIGERAACEVYHAFVFHLLDDLKSAGDQRTVVFSPPERKPDFRDQLPAGWNLCPQSDGDLGNRMRSFFEGHFNRPSTANRNDETKVVVIGADCPQLGQEQIQTAFDRLDDESVVIGPSTDGGYYLIGMKGRCHPVFRNIHWSSERVFEQTIALLQSHDVGYHLLPEKTDVDDFQSLLALQSELTERLNGLGDRAAVSTLHSVAALLRHIDKAVLHGPSVESE